MAVAARIESTYRVRFDESGPEGRLPGSGFLRYAQDLAWLHSDAAGFGRDWYRERGLTWLIRAVELDVLEDVEHGAELVASTEVIGFRACGPAGGASSRVAAPNETWPAR